jgi:Domain of unknown function (DUF4145)
LTQKFHNLDPEEAALLRLLLNETPQDDAGVDSLAFRAQHFDKVDVINRLDAEGYIRKDQERYFVSLTALVQLETDRARRILDDAEKLFLELKAHYAKTQRESILVDALAERAHVESNAAREALSYMAEGSWWAGRSIKFFGAADPYIQPGEAILGFRSFAAVVEQLRNWQAGRIRDRRQSLGAPLRNFAELTRASLKSTDDIQRQKPDWFPELPEPPRELLGEIYAGLNMNLRALCAMGVRAVIDIVCVELVGDQGTFETKLRLIQGKGSISEAERLILSAAIDAGSASAHRGHVPSPEDITTLIDITERLLHGHYILPAAAQKVKSNTPRRPPNPGKQTK